jgi:hypothetical protein
MSHIHVCLVSEQTIPNILGIYHFKPERVIFCTTERMEQEKRTDAIINALKLYGLDYSGLNVHDRIKVDQDCLDDCELKFKNEIIQKYRNDKITVNLTGGTKIMVLAAYNVFKDIAEQMIYTPIPKNEFLVVSPQKEDCKTPVSLNLRLSVEAYVTAYGGKVKNGNKIEQLKSNAKKNKDLCMWMAQNYNDIEDLLSEFYSQLTGHRGDKNFRLKMNCLPKKREERELLKRLEMSEGKIEKTLAKNEIKFLTGDWLSDFCFNEICKLSVDDCVTGIELISPKGSDNEFDVMFTKDNALYIIECKSLRQVHDKDADVLYKISALQHDFGLRVDGFLVSTSRNILSETGNIKEHILRRADQCKTKVIHPDEIKDFGGWIKKQVKGL